MDDEIKPQSAIGAALDMLDECESVDDLLKTAAELSEMFMHNEEVIEYLYEQSIYALDRIQPKKPTMTIELFRKLMGGTVADA